MMAKVGIFDSGIGGLSILGEIYRQDLDYEVYYIADSKNHPYGNKEDSFVFERSMKLVKKMIELDVDLIIIGCNTATAVVIDNLRKEFTIPFVGVEPYINIINQRKDLTQCKGVVLTTPLTSKSKRFKDLKHRLDKKNTLDYFYPINLAQIIEANFFGKINYEKEIFKELYFLKDYDFYILGCTHYPLVLNILKKKFKGEFISSAGSVVERVSSLLGPREKNKSSGKVFNFLKTDQSDNFFSIQYSSIFSELFH